MGEIHHPDQRGGGYGWALGALGVVLWDKYAPETMSNSYRRLRENHPLVAYGLSAVVNGHLNNAFPGRTDPIARFFEHVVQRPAHPP